MSKYDLVQLTDLNYNDPPYDAPKKYKYIKWEQIVFRKKTSPGMKIVICVWKSEARTKEEALLIPSGLWRYGVPKHKESCARGMNWWRDTQRHFTGEALKLAWF
jgi:hypothetical protein